MYIIYVSDLDEDDDSRIDWQSEYNEPLEFECQPNEVMHRVESKFNPDEEDRRWLFHCYPIVPEKVKLSCSSWNDSQATSLDQDFYYQCPTNKFIAGASTFF